MGTRLVALVRPVLVLGLSTCGSDKTCDQYDREAQQMEQNLIESYARDYPDPAHQSHGPCNPPPNNQYYQACQALADKRQQAEACRNE
jgi:hypothetical protein